MLPFAVSGGGSVKNVWVYEGDVEMQPIAANATLSLTFGTDAWLLVGAELRAIVGDAEQCSCELECDEAGNCCSDCTYDI